MGLLRGFVHVVVSLVYCLDRVFVSVYKPCCFCVVRLFKMFEILIKFRFGLLRENGSCFYLGHVGFLF